MIRLVFGNNQGNTVELHLHGLTGPICFDLIQIIFRELVCSLLKLLILKFVKNVKVNVVMRQHNI